MTDRPSQSSDPVPDGPSQAVRKAHRLCLQHAEDLVHAAKIVRDQGLFHISYHLSSLALEEIGKAGLIGMSDIRPDSEGASWARNRLDDHKSKLFWAFFGAQFGHSLVTKDTIEESRQLAHAIHAQRLEGLYVRFEEASPTPPSDAVSQSDCETLIGLAESRLDVEKLTGFRKLNDRDREILSWFQEATEDDEKTRLMMGRKSM